mgnify:CR=1 FL=1
MTISISFKDKIAVVTGAAGGLGESLVYKLAEAECAGIIINDINKSNAEKIAKKIENAKTKTFVVLADVSTAKGAKSVIDAAEKKWGKLDILVNNAGVCYRGNIWDESEKQFDKTIKVNLYSTFFCMKYASILMKKQKYGTIVNIGSTAGITGGTMGPSYAASKGGIIALSKHAARTLGKDGIRVNCIAPGYIETEMLHSVFENKKVREERWATIPLGRSAKPEEIANAVIFLLSDQASYILGDVLLVSGGRTS